MLNLICNPLSNRLSQDHKEALLRISLFKGHFDMEKVIDIWKRNRKRRVKESRVKTAQVGGTSDSESDSDSE